MQKLISGNLGKLMEPLMHYTNENWENVTQIYFAI